MVSSADRRRYPLGGLGPLARLCGAGRDAVENTDHLLDLITAEVLRDEDDARPVVVVGPALEPGDVVQKVLRALNHRRSSRLLRNIHQSLHPEKIRSEIPLQRVQKELQCIARGRFLANERKRRDRLIVMMMIVMIVVVMIVVMVIVVIVAR